MGIVSERNHDREQPEKVGRSYLVIKRILDIILALIGLVILALPMLIIALIILLFCGRPVFFVQTRLGKSGRHIRIIKFRSMCPNAEQKLTELPVDLQKQYRSEFKIDHDPRVTRIGGFLRRTSLDERPQLWNILKGDLSIVGPRPILPEEIQFYKETDRKSFLSVTPGLTGYWQACSKPDDTNTTGKRQKMELYYVQHQRVTLDAYIVACTVVTVIRKMFKAM